MSTPQRAREVLTTLCHEPKFEYKLIQAVQLSHDSHSSTTYASKWKSGKTKVLRVPEALANKVLSYAQDLDQKWERKEVRESNAPYAYERARGLDPTKPVKCGERACHDHSDHDRACCRCPGRFRSRYPVRLESKGNGANQVLPGDGYLFLSGSLGGRLEGRADSSATAVARSCDNPGFVGDGLVLAATNRNYSSPPGSADQGGIRDPAGFAPMGVIDIADRIHDTHCRFCTELDLEKLQTEG